MRPSAPLLICFNAKWLPAQDFAVSLSNRAFSYGDGLFETIITDTSGMPQYWPAHWQRLTRGMNALALEANATLNEQTVFEAAQRISQQHFPNQAARLRLRVWRTDGGLYTPLSNQTNWLLEAFEFEEGVSAKENAVISNNVKLHFSAWSAYKTCNSLPYIMAGIERQQRNADEIILTDTFGHLAECQSANLFWMRENMLFTPSLQTGCIDGIRRSVILEQAKQAGVTVEIGEFPAEALQEADVVFGSNVTGIFKLQKVENRRFDGELPEFVA